MNKPSQLHRDPAGLGPLSETKLPERPDYEATDRFLITARRGLAKETR
jgi:hypothetical protein